MKTAYTSAEEAHPNLHRPEGKQMPFAILRAIRKAVQCGNLRIEVPDQLRGKVNCARRHNFRSE